MTTPRKETYYYPDVNLRKKKRGRLDFEQFSPCPESAHSVFEEQNDMLGIARPLFLSPDTEASKTLPQAQVSEAEVTFSDENALVSRKLFADDEASFAEEKECEAWLSLSKEAANVLSPRKALALLINQYLDPVRKNVFLRAKDYKICYQGQYYSVSLHHVILRQSISIYQNSCHAYQIRFLVFAQSPLGNGNYGEVYPVIKALSLQTQEDEVSLLFQAVEPNAKLAKFLTMAPHEACLEKEMFFERRVLNEFLGNRHAQEHEMMPPMFLADEEGDIRYAVILMHFAPGVSLEAWLKQLFFQPVENEKEQRAELINLALGMVSAIGRMHSKGMTHGDLKPEHILVDEREAGKKVSVIDYGSVSTKLNVLKALPTGATPGFTSPTSAKYFSRLLSLDPDELKSEPARDFNLGHDIYALGIILALMFGCDIRSAPFMAQEEKMALLESEPSQIQIRFEEQKQSFLKPLKDKSDENDSFASRLYSLVCPMLNFDVALRPDCCSVEKELKVIQQRQSLLSCQEESSVVELIDSEDNPASSVSKNSKQEEATVNSTLALLGNNTNLSVLTKKPPSLKKIEQHVAGDMSSRRASPLNEGLIQPVSGSEKKKEECNASKGLPKKVGAKPSDIILALWVWFYDAVIGMVRNFPSSLSHETKKTQTAEKTPIRFNM